MTTWTMQDLSPATPEEDEAWARMAQEQQEREEKGKSFWNFRVVNLRTVDGRDADDWMEICEVFYDHEGKPAGFTSANPFGDNPKEIKAMLYKMIEATDKPVLTGSDFIGKFNYGDEN